MKKTLLMLLCACMLIGTLCICVSAADRNYGKTYSAPYGTPVLDGEIDPIWDLAPWADINVGHTENHAAVRFKILHDDTKIYFLAEMTDKYIGDMKSENVQMQLHTHTCSNPDTCTDFYAQQMSSDGSMWLRKTSTSIKPAEAQATYRITSKTVGESTVSIREWVITPANPIPANSTTPFGLEMIVDDYNASNGWIRNQLWNAYDWNDIADTTGNFGELYFMTLAETEAMGTSFFYSDVDATHKAYNAIVYTSEKGLFMPATATNPLFYPEKKLTRAQFVTILGRLADANPAAYTTTAFTDVNFARDGWFAPYAEWAREAGIVIGNQFMANKEISVSEAVVMLQRYAENVDNKYVAASAALSAYTDNASVPAWAKSAMQWAVANKLYPSEGTTLSPAQTMTRAMAAMLVYNYDTLIASVGADGNPDILYKEPPAGIDWTKMAVINALEFGFVNDGVTPNDGIMKYYIDHYATTIPLQFPNGTYAFKYTIDFPERIYLELAPEAMLILKSDTVQDYFITLQKGVDTWHEMDGYAQQSYIRGGRINANYNAKVGLALHGGFMAKFEGFKLENVLEKGIQTEINEFHDGAYTFYGILIYNDKAIKNTIAIYDNGYDNIFTQCTGVNFQTFIETSGGQFTQCSGWFNNYGKSLIDGSVYAKINDGYQCVFNVALVDTYQTGFDVNDWATISISDLVWITNTTFYDEDLQAKCPMTIFKVYRADTQIMVNGLAFQYLDGVSFSFSNMQLTRAVFLNVRYKNLPSISLITNFRDDTRKLLDLINEYSW